MSGHSRWSQIKRQKGSADVKRGVLFSKLANAIALAARSGLADPDRNVRLRLALARAKAANMPKENIERAIARGAGGADGRQLEEILYEAFAPGGISLLIEVLTDNKNRTVAALKRTLTEAGGNLGGTGSVAWAFERKGLLRTDRAKVGNLTSDAITETILESGADDFREQDGELLVITQPENMLAVQAKLKKRGIPVEDAAVGFVPKDPVQVPAREREQLEKLSQALDNLEDVQEYYTNVKD